MKTGRMQWFILLVFVFVMVMCICGCTGYGTCDGDGLMEIVQNEAGISGELIYGATCGKARLGNDDAVIWYYTDNDGQKKEYFPVEVEQAGQVRYRFVRILEPEEPAQDIAVALWQGGCCIFINNPQCVKAEVTGEDGSTWTEKNDTIYPMLYYYDDFEPREIRFLDADGNEVK